MPPKLGFFGIWSPERSPDVSVCNEKSERVEKAVYPVRPAHVNGLLVFRASRLMCVLSLGHSCAQVGFRISPSQASSWTEVDSCYLAAGSVPLCVRSLTVVLRIASALVH